MRTHPTHSLYLHIPFCLRRCAYCDFNTYAGLEALIPEYVSALCAEIEWVASSAGERLPAQTVYFGGGTPSLLPAEGLERIFAALHTHFDLPPGVEITLEANPGTLSKAYLADLRRLGVNRLSLGVQSAHPGELRLLGRIHDFPDAVQSFAWARQAGFDNLNLDLIFGLPDQPLATWQRTLELCLRLAPEHFSLYALTIEPTAPFGRWAARGLLPTPDPDLAADMYEWAAERLEIDGYTQYEISNWALHSPNSPPLAPIQPPSLACRHNLQYWRNLPYLGFGAGAHGYAAGFRAANLLSPLAYIQRFADPHLRPQQAPGFPGSPAADAFQAIDQATEIGETMMMGLRLTREGVSEGGFSQRFNRSLPQVFGAQIGRLQSLGLLEWASQDAEKVLRLTPKGRLLGNQVFMEFI